MLKTIVIPMFFLVFSGLMVLSCDDGSGDKGSVCGNGVLENGELCDLDQFGDTTCLSLGFDAGELTCSPTCEPVTSGCRACGNQRLDPGEACEVTLGDRSCLAAGYLLGIATCTEECTLETSGCEVPLACGNGLLDPGEACDLTAEDGGVPPEVTCGSVGLLPGVVVCDEHCQLDYIGCSQPAGTCGNGLLDGGEQCEDRDLGGKTCEDRFFFGGGTLRCYPDCTFDTSACSPVREGTTGGEPCEVGLPCYPADFGLILENGLMPHVCVNPYAEINALAVAACFPACERHADCPLGRVCLESDGVNYCGWQSCDTPGEACTLMSGLPGFCGAYHTCMVAGVREFGQECVVYENVVTDTSFPVFNFQYNPMGLCARGTCVPFDDPPNSSYGTCSAPPCDAPGVLAGTAPDTCPPLYNCMNTSVVQIRSFAPDRPTRSPDRGECLPMTDGLVEHQAGQMACNVVTQRMTYQDLPCPEGHLCVPPIVPDYQFPGSLYGTCERPSGTPLSLGVRCSANLQCGAGAACVMSDPFATIDLTDYPKACRRACDAAVFENNPACADLPEGTDWVCLSVTRFFTQDHGLTWTDPEDPENVQVIDPTPLGFCVPNRI